MLFRRPGCWELGAHQGRWKQRHLRFAKLTRSRSGRKLCDKVSLWSQNERQGTSDNRTLDQARCHPRRHSDTTSLQGPQQPTLFRGDAYFFHALPPWRQCRVPANAFLRIGHERLWKFHGWRGLESYFDEKISCQWFHQQSNTLGSGCHERQKKLCKHS